METLKNCFMVTLTLLFVACVGATKDTNSANNAQGTGTEENINTSSPRTSKSAKYDTQCFEAFDYDYRKMLTKEDVLKHVSVSEPNTMEMDYREKPISKQLNACTYKWASDRPDQLMKNNIGGRTMETPVPDKNTVAINNLSFHKGNAEDAILVFGRKYKSLSDEEYNEMASRIDEQQKDKTEEERNTMKSLIRARQNLSFTPVADLGSDAYWGRQTVNNTYLGVNLYVLAGTIEFEITVKVSDDDQENVRVATLLAQEVLDKCK